MTNHDGASSHSTAQSKPIAAHARPTWLTLNRSKALFGSRLAYGTFVDIQTLRFGGSLGATLLKPGTILEFGAATGDSLEWAIAKNDEVIFWRQGRIKTRALNGINTKCRSVKPNHMFQ